MVEHVALSESIGNSAEDLRMDVQLGRYALGYVEAVGARAELSKIGLSSIFQLLEQEHDVHLHRQEGKPDLQGEWGKMEDPFPSFEIVEFYFHADEEAAEVAADEASRAFEM